MEENDDIQHFSLKPHQVHTVVYRECYVFIIMTLIGLGLILFALLMWIEQVIFVGVIGAIFFIPGLVFLVKSVFRLKSGSIYEIVITSDTIELIRSHKEQVLINRTEIEEVRQLKGAVMVTTEGHKKGIIVYDMIEGYDRIIEHLTGWGFSFRKVSKQAETVLLKIAAKIIMLVILFVVSRFPKVGFPILFASVPFILFWFLSDFFKWIRAEKSKDK